MKIKIGILETGIPPQKIGGSEIQAFKLATYLSKDNKVTIFTRRYSGSEKYEKINGIDVFRISVLPPPFVILSYIFNTLYCIYKHRKKIDLLICFRLWPNGFIGKLFNIITKIPFLTSVRGGDWYFVEPHLWGKIILYPVMKKENKIVVQSESIGNEIRKKYPYVKTIIIPNGIEEDKRWAHGNSLIFIGNLLRRKGVNILIDAIEKENRIPVIIAGEGPERNRLVNKVKNMKLGHIQFVGKLKPENVKEMMINDGKILVLPAIEGEGFPNVILEALSVGLPVIASDIAGVKNLLNDGNAGILVQPNDTVKLKSAILKLWLDESMQKKLSLNGKLAVCKYSWNEIVHKWEVEFDNIFMKRKS